MSTQTQLTRYSLIFNYYFKDDMEEAFSSFGPAGSKAQLASIPGINHNSIGSQYDGYAGGISAPVCSDTATYEPEFEVRSIVPDMEADSNMADAAGHSQDADANC